ncbi:MAG TPA: class I SAM-dependent methyltransferase [Rugosimonospora sp.]|nr:class I SAM-dependent methyltransferase [Rugosimonospora sp.]
MADVYDTVYAVGRQKDYAAESTALVELIHKHHPDAASLLDVACGTGEHLRHLYGQFSHVAGLELAEPMRARAQAKLPGVTVHAGDMRDFTLGRTFDVVVCLFSAIGYAASTAELRAACQAMARHTAPGGLLIIDPWYHPGGWEGGHLDHTVAVTGERTVLRLAHSARDGRTSRVTYHYLVGDTGGVTYFTDRHDMTLFTAAEYTGAIRAAGCARVEFIDGWAAGRARILAVRD